MGPGSFEKKYRTFFRKSSRKLSKLKDFLATYNEAKDLINIGAYAKGSNPKWDIAIDKIDRINAYLKQGIMETVTMEESLNTLKEIVED